MTTARLVPDAAPVRSWVLVMLLFALAFVAACGSDPEPLAAPSASPVAQPSPPPATSAQPSPPSATSAQPSPTFTPVPTPQPSATPEPTATPTTTPTVTPTPVDPFDFVEIVDADCPPSVAAAGVSCQFARLPEDSGDAANGASVELLLARAGQADADAEPVVFIQGGPGGGGTESAKYFTNQPLDIFFVDLRGTGGSIPSLNCEELDAAYPDFVALPSRSDALETSYLDAEQRCRDRLAANGIDLDTFDTATYAEDLELVRRALGYERWNLWGVSYGTRVALEAARLYPEGIESIVIDSVLPAPVDFFAGISATAQGSIARVVDGCAIDDGCAERYGDLDVLLLETVSALDAQPVTVTAKRPVSGEAIEVLVDGPRFYDMLFGQLYRRSVIGRLPLLIDRASRGDLTELVERTLADADPESQQLAEGVYFTTWCQDEVPFHAPDADEVIFALESEAFREAFEYPMDDHCNIWEVERSEAVVDTAVVSDVPALVFAGGFDPITPPAYALAAADTLENATTVVMAKHAHGMFTACPAAIMQAFLEDPTVAPDTACADDENAKPMKWQQ